MQYSVQTVLRRIFASMLQERLENRATVEIEDVYG